MDNIPAVVTTGANATSVFSITAIKTTQLDTHDQVHSHDSRRRSQWGEVQEVHNAALMRTLLERIGFVLRVLLVVLKIPTTQLT